ncbi:hypothetical protein KBI23_21865 [bacterium]|nr:hypothetical protein [bacterium]MBP9810771.1 hypothetical protein [bacterium]
MNLESKSYIASGVVTLSLCFISGVHAQIDPVLPGNALTGTASPGMTQSSEGKDQPLSRKMNPALTAIATAKQLEEASLRSGKLAPSVSAAIKLGAPAREDLEWIIANGSPAGRLYATAILSRFDQSAAKEAYRALVAGMGDVNIDFVGAHEHCHYSVADIATDQTSTKPLIEIVPRATGKAVSF